VAEQKTLFGNQRLTQEQKERVVRWISEKSGMQAPKCPVCRERQWSIADDLVAPPVFAGGGIVLGGASYPAAMLICGNCGNTQFLNAVIMGILPRKSEGTK
jgi:hypothetical protein